MVKKAVNIIACVTLITLLLAGCGEKIDKDIPVFETEGISTVSFKSVVSDWLMVPSDDLPVFVEWLGTFRASEKVKYFIPGDNQVEVRIEYSDGTFFENGLSTIRIGNTDYRITCENAPEEYLKLKLWPDPDDTETAEKQPEGNPSGKASEKRWDYPIDMVRFSNLEEFLEYLKTADENTDVANLASLEFFYYPTGIPEGYILYKITAGAVDIGFWFLPAEDCSSEDTKLAGEAGQKHFQFISFRDKYETAGGNRITNKIIWEKSDAALMMYLPKGYSVSDRDSLCETVKYVRNDDTHAFEME